MTAQNLSQYGELPDASDMRFGVLVSEWNGEVTFAMRDAAVATLLKHGAKEDNIVKFCVPGSFELTAGAQMMANNCDLDAIICIGCVIRGETPHFDYICQGVSMGLTQIAINHEIPVIFGVLTVNDLQQALDRAGGKHGNKGVEAAATAIKMVALQQTCEAY